MCAFCGRKLDQESGPLRSTFAEGNYLNAHESVRREGIDLHEIVDTDYIIKEA